MILYSGRFWGLSLLFHVYGSCILRSVVFATVSGIATWLIYDYAPKNVSKALKNNNIFGIYAGVLSFLVVYRSNLAYARYWEARTTIQTIMSRLSTFIVEATNNELGGLKESATSEQRKSSLAFLDELMHLTSLLFAVMMKQLRKDYNLNDLYDHEKSHHAAYVDSKKVHKGLSRWWVSFVYAMSLADFFPALQRPQQEVALPVLGGIRPSELRLLEDAGTSLDMQTKGGDLNGLRTVVLFGVINKLYLKQMNAGGQAGNAGFQGRVMGMVTESMGQFAQCVKISATQFPFPWAQLLMVLLCILGITLPFVVTSFMDQLWVGVIASFIVMTAFWSINETAVELDEPFGTDPNDLPLARFVYELNQSILAARRQLQFEYGEGAADTLYGMEDEAKEEAGGATRTSAVRLEMVKQ